NRFSLNDALNDVEQLLTKEFNQPIKSQAFGKGSHEQQVRVTIKHLLEKKLASKDFRDSGITNISLEEEKGFLPSSHIITVVGQKKDEDGKAKFDASSLEKSDIKLYRYVHEEKKGFAEGNFKVAMKLIDEQTKEEYVKAQFKDHKELSPQLGTILNML